MRNPLPSYEYVVTPVGGEADAQLIVELIFVNPQSSPKAFQA
jgi:hypothetical protein